MTILGSTLVYSTDWVEDPDFCPRCGQDLTHPSAEMFCPAPVMLSFTGGEPKPTPYWYCHRCERNSFSCECDDDPEPEDHLI